MLGDIKGAVEVTDIAGLKRHYETFAKRSAAGKASTVFGVGGATHHT